MKALTHEVDVPDSASETTSTPTRNSREAVYLCPLSKMLDELDCVTQTVKRNPGQQRAETPEDRTVSRLIFSLSSVRFGGNSRINCVYRASIDC
jgi:hypothetical protein